MIDCDPNLVAASCLYLCSKNFDPKYLYARTFLQGCEMTSDRQIKHKFESGDLLTIENQVFGHINYSLSC
jgi:hypothetical protein